MDSHALGSEEFSQTLAAAEQRRIIRLQGLQRFVGAERVYLFGYGGKGRSLARQIASSSSVRVIVFDTSSAAREQAVKDGFEVVSDLAEASQSTCGIILGACQSQAEQAALAGSNHIYFEEAAYLFDAAHVTCKARDYPAWVSANKSSLFEVYRAVHDVSRQNFLSMLVFRLSLDPADLVGFRREVKDMWFDVLESRGRTKYSTFLDVGAYDGDTLLAASKRLGTCKGIAVEANTALFPAIENVARVFTNGIEIVPCAAWSHACRLKFAEVRGGMITVSESTDGELAAGRLDDYVHEPVDLIKMDIEGAELKALMGCLKTLRSGPDIALAGYHRPDDFVQLSVFFAGAGYLSQGWEFHVVHYSDCLDDTILYFIRTEKQ